MVRLPLSIWVLAPLLPACVPPATPRSRSPIVTREPAPPFNQDGTVNDTSGNFSTNYVEAGLVDVASEARAISDYFILVLAHPAFLMDSELRRRYSPYAIRQAGRRPRFAGSPPRPSSRAFFGLDRLVGNDMGPR